MKKLLFLVIFPLAFIMGCSSELKHRADVTVPPTVTAAYTESGASDISFSDPSGKLYQLSDYFGKPIVLKFWNPDHENAMNDLETIESFYQTRKDDIHFFLLSPVGKDTLSEDFNPDKISIPFYSDGSGEAAKIYGVQNEPAVFFIDSDSFIVAESKKPLSEEAFSFALNLL